MGYSIGYDPRRDRYIGYGVPATCEHPGCKKKIDRGMAYACNGWYEDGCGLFFCSEHLFFGKGESHFICERCNHDKEPFEQKPDHIQWVRFMLKDKSWKEWRSKHPEKVKDMQQRVDALKK